MKRFICLVLPLFFIFLFCSCNKSSDVAAVTTGLSFTAKLSHQDKIYEYSYAFYKDGTAKADLISDKLTTSLFFSDDTVKYSYMDLEHTQNLKLINENLIIDFIYKVLKDADGKKLDLNNNCYSLTGKTDKYTYTIYFGETGLPIKIEEPQKNIEVLIKNPSIIT